MSEGRAGASSPASAGPGFGRAVGLLTVVRLGAAGAGFLTSVLAARILGPSELGAAGVGLTVGSIAALVGNGGLNIATTYFLGRRPSERRLIAHRSLTLALAAAVLAAALVLVVVRPLALELFGTEDGGLLVATAIVAAGIVGYEIGGGLLLGLERRGPYLVTQVIEGIGSLVLSAVLLLTVAPTAAGMVLGAGLAYVVASVFAATVAMRTVGGRPLAFDGGYAREALAMGLRGQVGNIVQFLNLRLDLLLVPLLLDLGAAGIYLVAVRMSEVVTQLASAAATMLFPAVSRTAVTHTALTERTVRAALLGVAILGLAIGILAPWLLTTFFGPEFEAGTLALRITMLAMLPLSVTRLLAGDLKGRGRAGLVSLSASIALVATIVLDLVLIPRLGIAGAALASLVAYGVGAAALLAAYRAVTGAAIRGLVPTLADAVRLLAGARDVARGRAAGDHSEPRPGDT